MYCIGKIDPFPAAGRNEVVLENIVVGIPVVDELKEVDEAMD